MTDELFQVEAKDTREVAISSNALIERALAHPDAAAMVTVIEKLIAMKNAEEDRQSKIAFEDAFARMKAELPTIQKSKEVKRSSGQHMYNYAPLEDIQKVCDPVLRKHGFAYAWREEAIADGKRVWFDLFGHGHTRSNFFDAPLLAAKMSNSGGEIVNAVQAARMTSSYAKRNSMVDGLGLVIEDEDSDGRVEIDEAVEALFAKIENATTDEALMNIYKVASEQYKDKENTKMLIYGKCQDRRRQLREGTK